MGFNVSLTDVSTDYLALFAMVLVGVLVIKIVKLKLCKEKASLE